LTPTQSTTKYFEVAEVEVEIEVNDREAIERVTGPGGDEWRSYAYQLHTERDVLEHWAYNAVANGVERINRLDGWGDLPDDAVRLRVRDVRFS
jgi:hypothetical protein